MSLTTTPHVNKPAATSSPDDAVETAIRFLAAADDAVSNYLAQFHGGDTLATATKSHPILVAEVMRAAIHLQTGKKRRKTG